MMTFTEFLNKKDHRPLTQMILPTAEKPGLQVSQILNQDLLTPFKPSLPTKFTPILAGRPLTDRAAPKKPSDFLARKGSSFRQGF